MEVIATLKGGSLSKTEVLADNSKRIVRKSISRKYDREYGLVRWQSQIRKLQLLRHFLPNNVIKIVGMGSDSDNYYYDIPFIEGADNCCLALKRGVSPILMASKISDLLKQMFKIKFCETKGALSVYLAEEVEFPIAMALRALHGGKIDLSGEESAYFAEELQSASGIVTALKSKYSGVSIIESLTHGNLTLENILWDYETESLIMIDPYAETYCETIAGDFSQILQSTASGYEYISEIFSKEEFFIDRYPIDTMPGYLSILGSELMSKVEHSEWFMTELVNVLHASQFTRMFPFKLVNNPRQGVAFMLHGLRTMRGNCVK